MNVKQVSLKKFARHKFHKNNQHATSPTNKTSFARKKINLQVLRREESICNKFQEDKSARTKFNEQNQFHEEKNQCTSFMKRKINTQQVLEEISALNKFK